MKDNPLMDMIWNYCKEEKFTGTMNELNEAKYDTPSLVRLFERHFERNKPKELSFTFTLNSERSNLRKRISQMDSEKESSSQKKMKTEIKKERKKKMEPVPEYFLQLLDELGLKREDARTLFDNKEKWVYTQSDRKIFCVKSGTLLYLSGV